MYNRNPLTILEPERKSVWDNSKFMWNWRDVDGNLSSYLIAWWWNYDNDDDQEKEEDLMSAYLIDPISLHLYVVCQSQNQHQNMISETSWQNIIFLLVGLFHQSTFRKKDILKGDKHKKNKDTQALVRTHQRRYIPIQN